MKGLILLGILFFATYPTVALACPPPASAPAPPPAPAPSVPLSSNSMMGPAASNGLNAVLQLSAKAHALLDQATEQGFDVSNISDFIAEADALLEKAQKIRICNPIPASNMIREASAVYAEAISELEALLG